MGAIDGKLVELQCPRNSASEYFKYKNAFSIILFVLVDANYNFMFVDVGCQGRMSDSGTSTLGRYKIAKGNSPAPNFKNGGTVGPKTQKMGEIHGPKVKRMSLKFWVEKLLIDSTGTASFLT